jgi:hypothetical protein
MMACSDSLVRFARRLVRSPAPLNRTKKISSAKVVAVPVPLPPVHSPPTPPTAVVEVAEAKTNETLTSGVKIKNKLETLSTRFDGFEDELNLSRNKKKADEDKRILILQTQLNNLQSSLALESKNRAMSVKALQNVSPRSLRAEASNVVDSWH